MKKILRETANRWLVPRGMEIVHHQLERLPAKQLMLSLHHFDIDLILDVGANVGQFGQELLMHRFNGDIVSIEPLPDAHATLKETAKLYPRWTVLDPVAAGADQRMVEISIAGNSYSSSVLEMLDTHIAAAPNSAPIGKINVQQKTLDDIFSGILSARRSVMLKIDTQGYEFPILQGASRCLENASLVLLELSLQKLYRDQMLWLDLINYMAEKGFSVWSIQPEFCDPRTGQMLQVNGLFYRTTVSH
ncbi:MAG: FkbM family methyltransferase [Steroidobacteraceae bacterium]